MKSSPTLIFLLTALGTATLLGQDKPKGQGAARKDAGGPRPEEAPVDDVRFLFKTEIPPHSLDVILGRPTRDSVLVSILSAADSEAVIDFSPQQGPRGTTQTMPFVLKAGEPTQIPLTELQSDTRYTYQLKTRATKNAEWQTEPPRTFSTQRAPGSSFTFSMQADPHLDYNTDLSLYQRCLANALADQPDFFIDLGDTFMTDKHRGRETAASQYLAQRFYFGQIAHSAPLFLVLGNHDAEAGRWLDGTQTNLAVWANHQRKRYFSNPIPDGFYTGNATPDPQAGLLQNYYAWEWGDALFIVLDPFWFTTRQRGGDDNWSRTLGREQYDWLAATLSKSRAKFRFVFLHHLVGGIGREARGGAEAATLYEWGGHEPEGTDVFKSKRLGWPTPIHNLLVQNHVNAVFHGHDHLYVKQELDGVVYQEVPQPGYARYDNTRSASDYGYKTGTIQGSSGHLRVRVDAKHAVVEYVRAYLPADENASRKNRAISERYELLPR